MRTIEIRYNEFALRWLWRWADEVDWQPWDGPQDWAEFGRPQGTQEEAITIARSLMALSSDEGGDAVDWVRSTGHSVRRLAEREVR